MKSNLKALLCNRYAVLWCAVFAAIVITAPHRGPMVGVFERLFMAAWCASGLVLASLHLFNLPAARIVLDGLFTLKGQLTLFGRQRDAYAMSDLTVRSLGIGLLVITSLGFYDIFFTGMNVVGGRRPPTCSSYLTGAVSWMRRARDEMRHVDPLEPRPCERAVHLGAGRQIAMGHEPVFLIGRPTGPPG